MNTYHIAHTQGCPDWAAIASLEMHNCPWLPNPGIDASAQLAWDSDSLWVHLRAHESDIRAECTAPLSMVCEDSCLEFFFQPDTEDGRYFNFEANPNGRMYIGIGHGRADCTRMAPDDEDRLFSKDVHRCEGGWEIFYRIPCRFIRVFFPHFAPKAGLVMRANCFKCGDLTRRPHYLSWSPCTSPSPDFHQPRDFGTMVLDA